MVEATHVGLLTANKERRLSIPNTFCQKASLNDVSESIALMSEDQLRSEQEACEAPKLQARFATPLSDSALQTFNWRNVLLLEVFAGPWGLRLPKLPQKQAICWESHATTDWLRGFVGSGLRSYPRTGMLGHSSHTAAMLDTPSQGLPQISQVKLLSGAKSFIAAP